MKASLLCPAGQRQPGAMAFGAMAGDRIRFFGATELFEAMSAPEVHPEDTYRFAHPCVKSACRNWAGSACSLGEHLVAVGAECGAPEYSEPHCAISNACRWLAERGPSACVVCPFILRGSVPAGEQAHAWFER